MVEPGAGRADAGPGDAAEAVTVGSGYCHRGGPKRERRMTMNGKYAAVVQQQGEWWIGWVEEVPGVNSQGATREELLDNLRDALDEALEMNRADARAAAAGAYEEVSLSP